MHADSTNSYLLRREQPGDESAIRTVQCRAFDRSDEANLVDALRSGGHVVLSLLATVDQQVIGHVLFSRILIHTPQRTLTAVSLAPVAVLPDQQRRGVGSALIRAGLAECQQQGETFVLVLGDPAYYGRFGFSAAAATGLECAYAGPHLMALRLDGDKQPLVGRVEYSEPFRRLDD